MGVHDFHRVRLLERQLTSQNLVQRDTQCVIVCTLVGASVHAPGLLRGNVAQCARQVGQVLGLGKLTAQARGNAEVDDLGLLAAIQPEDVAGVEVLVHDVLVMHFGQRARQGNGQNECLFKVWLVALEVLGQRYAAAVLHDDAQMAIVGLEGVGFDHVF